MNKQKPLNGQSFAQKRDETNAGTRDQLEVWIGLGSNSGCRQSTEGDKKSIRGSMGGRIDKTMTEAEGTIQRGDEEKVQKRRDNTDVRGTDKTL